MILYVSFARLLLQSLTLEQNYAGDDDEDEEMADADEDEDEDAELDEYVISFAISADDL